MKKKMKLSIVILIVLIMAFAFSACGKTATPTDSTGSTGSTAVDEPVYSNTVETVVEPADGEEAPAETPEEAPAQ